MTGKTSSYTPISVSGHPVSDSSIGDGSHFIQQLLDRLCQQSLDCARMMKDIYHSHTPKEGASTSKKGKGSLDNEERRRKARERQQKLMADFASKQKAFMEQAMETDGKLGYLHLSHIKRNPVFGVSDQVQHKPGCTTTEDG